MNKFFIKAKSDYFIIAVILSLVSGAIVIACVFLNSGVFPFSPVKFSVFKPALGVTVENPFGVAYGEGSEYLSGFMADIRDLGVNRTKVCFYWNDLEPTPGNYAFYDSTSPVYKYLTQLTSTDNALMCIFSSSDWCSDYDNHPEAIKGAPMRQCPTTQPNCEAQTCKDYYFKNFIQKLTQEVQSKANGGIKYWQLDTEPASSRHYPKDHAADYGAAYQVFHNTVKSVLPSAIMAGVSHNGGFTALGQPSGNEAVNWDSGTGEYIGFFDYVLKYGKDYYDKLDIRLYKDRYDVKTRVDWFKQRMQSYGYDKPIISVEYGGPDSNELYDEEGKNIYQKTLDAAREYSGCSESDLKCVQDWVQNPANSGYIDPKMQIFLQYASQDQNDKRNRMHCHDITQREILILNAGVKELWRWNLRSDIVSVVFGKMRLMDDTHTLALNPQYTCYQRMVGKLGNVLSVEKITHSDSSIYFFKITKSGTSDPIYVAWHRDAGKDPYDAEAAIPVDTSLNIGLNNVKITKINDTTGAEETEIKSSPGGILSTNIGDNPLYIENNPDTIPPVRSNGSPSGTFPVGTTQTTLSLTTNENATCRYSTTANTSYSSMTNIFLTTGGTSHSTTISGLQNGQTYHYYVRCQDSAGNTNTDDFQITFSVATPADTTPPIISSISASSITYNSVTITWTTNEPSDSQVEYGLSASYGSQTTLDTSMLTAHSVLLSGLSFSTTYHYRIKSKDAAGNLATSGDYTFTTSVAPTLTVSLSANPSSGIAPLSGIDLTATVSGDVAGNINYIFYCDRSDIGSNITTPYAGKYDNISQTTYTASDICSYSQAGINTAKVIAERGGYQTETRISIIVSSSGQLPYPNGSVVKTATSEKIYFIVNNQKRWLVNPQVFISYGFVLGSQLTISQTDLDRYPTGPDITEPSLPEGSLIRAKGDFKVWIIKPPYKRHIFNPAIFNMYQHFSWASIKDVESDIVSSYITSDLYRADGDYHVYSLEEIDEAQGKAIKHHLNLAAEQFTAKGYSWNQIFIVNTQERDYYQTGGDLTQ